VNDSVEGSLQKDGEGWRRPLERSDRLVGIWRAVPDNEKFDSQWIEQVIDRRV
jgi:hypothetical protein